MPVRNTYLSRGQSWQKGGQNFCISIRIQFLKNENLEPLSKLRTARVKGILEDTSTYPDPSALGILNILSGLPLSSRTIPNSEKNPRKNRISRYPILKSTLLVTRNVMLSGFSYDPRLRTYNLRRHRSKSYCRKSEINSHSGPHCVPLISFWDPLSSRIPAHLEEVPGIEVNSFKI